MTWAVVINEGEFDTFLREFATNLGAGAYLTKIHPFYPDRILDSKPIEEVRWLQENYTEDEICSDISYP